MEMTRTFRRGNRFLMGIVAHSKFRPPGFLLVSGLAFFLTVLSAPAAPHQTLSPHHVPAAAKIAKPNGRLPGATQLELEIGLPLRNKDQLASLMQELYDPASTNFHQFLTAQQFIERFGPDPADYQAVIQFARANGLRVTQTFPDSTLLVVSGPATNVENAFHLHLLTYSHPNEPRNFFAPDAEPSLDLDVPVLDISGLDDFVIPHPMGLHLANHTSALNPAAYTGSGPSQNFIGNDFRAAYVPGVSLTGAGQTVGLLEFDDYYPADVTSYENLAGLPNVPISVENKLSSQGNANTEVTLDIEMAISMAPGLAKVVVYEGTRANTILTQMANDQLAQQISASWTYSVNSTTTNLFHRFATQGQSFFNASGDSGAYTGAPSPPTDDPYITVVGGTTLSTAGAGGSWTSESVWNWNTTGEGTNASSGGISLTYPLPSWQAGVNMTNNQGSASHRNLPDVALTADNIWTYYNNGSSGEVGGTSAAAPLWAAFNALVNQQSLAMGGSKIGFINPAVYTLGLGTNYNLCFHDITTGNNTNAFTSTKFFATNGFDLCTGWGTPNGAALISALTQGSPLITNQPVNQVVSPGGNVTFAVGAIAVGKTLSYQWKFNGTNILSATNSSYSIASAQPANQGNYSVVVSTPAGSVTSSNASLTVNAPPLISGQPQSLTVPQGNSATFTVTASGSPPPTYQWQFNGTNISTATTSAYTVTNAQLTNQGNYSVIVSNPGGSVASSNAVLTVDAPPSISTQPASHTVNQNSNVLFFVTASGSPTLAYQWQLNGTNIAGATNFNYYIGGVQFSQSGNYTAVVTNDFGSATSAVAVLTVNAPPAITDQPQNQSAPSGSNALFTLTATGSAPLSYQWLFNSNLLAGATNSSLAFASVLPANAGYYQVMVSNAFGVTNSSNVTLNVLGVPVSFIGAPGGVQYANGQFTFQLAGLTGQGAVVIQSSSNLTDWISIYTNPPAFGHFQFTDTNAANSPVGYYRVVTPASP